MKSKSIIKVNKAFFEEINTILRAKYKPTFSEMLCLLITEIKKKLRKKNIKSEEKERLNLMLLKIYKETRSKRTG